jgi:TfoX/Sxy family transcriptional regulator of competence genes
MAYDEGLAQRIRDHLGDDPRIDERKMFGGLAFLSRGNLACGIVGDELMVRVGPDAWPDALARPHAREMDFTGRSMKGMVYVAVEGLAADDDLHAWIDRGLAYAQSQPPKR